MSAINRRIRPPVTIDIIDFVNARIGSLAELTARLSSVDIIELGPHYTIFSDRMLDEGIELTDDEMQLLFMAVAELCMLHAQDLSDSLAGSIATVTIAAALTDEIRAFIYDGSITNISDHIDTSTDIVNIAVELGLCSLIPVSTIAVPVGWLATPKNTCVHIGHVFAK